MWRRVTWATVADLGEVDLVEQAHLQRAVVGGQGGDRRGA
jgi:hypothetical protein